MANKHMIKCSVSLIIREMKVKTTMRYHFTSLLGELLKRETKTKQKIIGVGKDGKKLEALCIVSENVKQYSHKGKQYSGFSKNEK